MPWTNFRNLCSYYIDCVKYSEKSQEYLFPSNLNIDFMLPTLELDWYKKEEFVTQILEAQKFIADDLLLSNKNDEIFIGYPLQSFISPRGTYCICPIMLFPVEVCHNIPGVTTELKIKIDPAGIDINRDWIDYHVAKEDQKRVLNVFTQNLIKKNFGDAIESILCFISNTLKVGLNPNKTKFSVNHKDSENGILNTAALFIGTKTKYTRNLIEELKRIRDEPDDVLDSTSLAYVFRNPCLENKCLTSDDNKIIPATFTEGFLNSNQFKAIESALNHPVTKVSGPPGTGKSHMAVNLIANELYNGGNVLFTSKNHKAVHAIFDMCQSVEINDNIEFVQFCTKPGVVDGAFQWDKAQNDVYSTVDKVSNPKFACDDGSVDYVERCFDTYRDAEKTISKYEVMRKTLSHYEKLLISIEELLSEIPEITRNSPEFKNLLNDIKSRLHDDSPKKIINKLKKLIDKLFIKQSNKINLYEQLNNLVPQIAPYFLSKNSVEKRISQLLKKLESKRLVTSWIEKEYETIKNGLSNEKYEELLSVLTKEQSDLKKHLYSAYSSLYCERVLSVEKIEDVYNKFKQLAKFLFTQKMLELDDYKEYLNVAEEFYKLFPAVAVTLLSLKNASPCLPGVFSLVVIDEAAQCEIPPIIPALYRAKRVVVVGDVKQFPPVVTLNKNKNEVFMEKWGLNQANMSRFSFMPENNAFTVIKEEQSKSILLADHFRCVDEIANYFNEEFYDKELCPCVGEKVLSYGFKPGMSWVDANQGDDDEIEKAIEYLKKLKEYNYTGDVGVISPFRKVADKMKTRCFQEQKFMPKGLTDEHINTANGFQGGQCGVIIFLLGLNCDRDKGEYWYITSEENKYIYNVSVSRAQLSFVTIGDREMAMDSGKSRIVNLVPKVGKFVNQKIGPGEKILKEAMISAGMNPIPQYPDAGRYLDLAIVDGKVKIDVEVDGQAYHLDRNGCVKAEDIHRDMLLSSRGWKIIRFWHYEVVNNVEDCVQRIQSLVEQCK